MTFENNTIEDEKGVCVIFKQLRQFEKIEALPYKKFNISIDKIKKLYNLKLDSIRLKLF
jgi:hypothetical protein